MPHNTNRSKNGNIGIASAEQGPTTENILTIFRVHVRIAKNIFRAVFRGAGYRAGTYFAENCLDLTAEFPAFIAQVQRRLEEFRIGLLRVEEMEEDTGKMVLTISEDVDCSGLPVLGKTVCNYDEGFLAGLLTAYTKRPYSAVEVNCWATGDRVCRFRAEVQNNGG